MLMRLRTLAYIILRTVAIFNLQASLFGRDWIRLYEHKICSALAYALVHMHLSNYIFEDSA